MLYSIKTLQQRLVIQVTLGLLVFSFLAGIFTYQYSYKHQLEVSLTFQNQLVRTIQSQAEVAAFASNEEIGQDILNGLLTNPLLRGVKLESTEMFRLEKITESENGSDTKSDINFTEGMIYPLFSPVDGKEQIGSLTVVKDNKYIRNQAAEVSRDITFLMLFQLLMAALLIVWVSRKVISKPVSSLAKEVISVKPGESSRITVEQIHAHDEIGMLSGSINSFIDAAADALSESSAAREIAEMANRARSEFLDNSGEGFLSFGADMLISTEYSRECESIFQHWLSDLTVNDDDRKEGHSDCSEHSNRGISGSNVSDLMFGKEPSNSKDAFKKTLELIFNEPLDLKRELYISLLQPVYQIGEKHIKAKYQLIAGDTKMMLILTDITREKVLEQHVENERKRLKFVITAVRETRDFFAILDELNQFKQKNLPLLLTRIKQGVCDNNGNYQEVFNVTLYEIYRHIHTFKGLFAQQEFLFFPEFLHEMETRISKIIGKISGMVVDKGKGTDTPVYQECENRETSINTNHINNNIKKEIESFTEDFRNETVLEQDLLIIRAFLGDEFIERKGDVVISSELASKIESVATSLIEMMGENIDSETLGVLEQVKRLRYVDIKSFLTPHVEGLFHLAERLGKYITPFQVEGDELFVHPDRLAPFTRSLVNVFRNAVVHGIEEPDDRTEAEKDEYATIECRVKKSEGYFEVEKHAEAKKYGECKKYISKDYDNAGGYVEITISDDGRGIDLAAIRKKIVAKGLMGLEQVETIPEAELLQFIFFDDFSTRDIVDTMSGRGMGLSGVKTELEKLNGRVEIETEFGRGTCFRFYIPM